MPWEPSDFEMPEMKRQWSGEVHDETLKLHGRVGGLVPVQGTGELEGKPWYFRARHEGWTFTMAKEGGDVHKVRSMFHGAALEDGWNIEKEWPFGTFSAGYMPVKAALAIVRACARMYYAGRLPLVVADPVKYAEESQALKVWADEIRAGSYCDCAHNQPQHGIGEHEVEAEKEESSVMSLAHKADKCQECDCLDFHYSAEQTRRHHMANQQTEIAAT
jgi:hypothetical protein